MRTHKIKIEDDHWDNIVLGRKKFEVRYNDRNYQLGDKIIFLTEDGCFERGIDDEEESEFKIIFVQSGYGIKEDYVVLGIELK